MYTCVICEGKITSGAEHNVCVIKGMERYLELNIHWGCSSEISEKLKQCAFSVEAWLYDHKKSLKEIRNKQFEIDRLIKLKALLTPEEKEKLGY